MRCPAEELAVQVDGSLRVQSGEQQRRRCPGPLLRAVRVTTVTERYSRVAWHRDASAPLLLAALYAQAPIDLHCNSSAGQRIPGPWREQPLPEWSPPPEPARHCPASEDSAGTALPGSPQPLCAG
ncbi:unnamed protein product [Lampetra fluviatilis]